MPFVQGQLRNESITITIETECSHSGRRLHLEVDSDLRYRVIENDAAPMLFVPLVEFEKLEAPNIIDVF
jgi:hypothetical protein